MAEPSLGNVPRRRGPRALGGTRVADGRQSPQPTCEGRWGHRLAPVPRSVETLLLARGLGRVSWGRYVTQEARQSVSGCRPELFLYLLIFTPKYFKHVSSVQGQPFHDHSSTFGNRNIGISSAGVVQILPVVPIRSFIAGLEPSGPVSHIVWLLSSFSLSPVLSPHGDSARLIGRTPSLVCLGLWS